MRVETVEGNGASSWVVGLAGTRSERFRRVTLTADDLATLTILDPQHSYAGDGRLLRLGLQAYALGIAYEFDQPARLLGHSGLRMIEQVYAHLNAADGYEAVMRMLTTER